MNRRTGPQHAGARRHPRRLWPPLVLLFVACVVMVWQLSVLLPGPS